MLLNKRNKMIKIWQNMTRVKRFGTKVPNRHYSKDEAKSRFSSENAIFHFLKVFIFYSKT